VLYGRVVSKRERLIRFVLIAGILTTVATSAPQGFVRDAFEMRALSPLDVARVRIVYSADASRQADDMRIEFVWGGSGTIMLVPDDPALPPVQLDSRHDIDARLLCGDTCDLGFTIDVGDAASGTLEVTATAERAGDGSLCFPDNRDFEGDATVEVIFE
jgi:hypothetical protein